MTNVWEKIKGNDFVRRMLVLVGIIAILYWVRSMMNLILFTFIFTFLIVKWVRLIQRCFTKVPSWIIVLLTYVVLIILVYLTITRYLPVLVNQITKIVNSMVKYYQHNGGTIIKYVHHYVSNATIVSQTRHWMGILVTTLTNVGALTVTFFMSLILSFFYTIELEQMNSFSRLFLKSKLAWLFKDVHYFGKIFVNTFGVVIEAQFFIALCNTAITTICLIFMKMPQIFALSIMVFVLSLIPVAGVIISLFPLSMVAFTVGGWRDVIYILIMITCIHMLESYVLNPKFMSSRTELPIFYTFVILVFSEHFFGGWGLIVGVPIFTFFLDVFGVQRDQVKKESPKKTPKKAN